MFGLLFLIFIYFIYKLFYKAEQKIFEGAGKAAQMILEVIRREENIEPVVSVG